MMNLQIGGPVLGAYIWSHTWRWVDVCTSSATWDGPGESRAHLVFAAHWVRPYSFLSTQPPWQFVFSISVRKHVAEITDVTQKWPNHIGKFRRRNLFLHSANPFSLEGVCTDCSLSKKWQNTLPVCRSNRLHLQRRGGVKAFNFTAHFMARFFWLKCFSDFCSVKIIILTSDCTEIKILPFASHCFYEGFFLVYAVVL